MGFGLNLFFAFIIIPLMGILLLAWIFTRKKVFGLALGSVLLGLLGIFSLLVVLNRITTKKDLEKKDYYGEYTIDRKHFPGKQADWQYNSFRFEIKPNDSIYFYRTNGEKIIQLYRGKITTTQQYQSQRLILEMDQPTHHILSENPTTYRSTWSYYLVFYSPKFNNVFFKKGKWKPIETKNAHH